MLTASGDSQPIRRRQQCKRHLRKVWAYLPEPEGRAKVAKEDKRRRLLLRDRWVLFLSSVVLLFLHSLLNTANIPPTVQKSKCSGDQEVKPWRRLGIRWIRQHKIIPAFQLPTTSVMLEEDGFCVYSVDFLQGFTDWHIWPPQTPFQFHRTSCPIGLFPRCSSHIFL